MPIHGNKIFQKTAQEIAVRFLLAQAFSSQLQDIQQIFKNIFDLDGSINI